jgi:hypothetical protein
MKTSMQIKLGLAATAALAAVGSALAAPITYFGNNAADQAANGTIPLGSAAVASRVQFLTALGSKADESFSTATLATAFGNTAVISQETGATGKIESVKIDSQGNFPGRFNTTPDPVTGQVGDGKWWNTSTSFTVQVRNATINAFGFFGTDFGDFDGNLKFDLFLGSAKVRTDVLIPGDGGKQNGSLMFYGYTDDQQSFDKIVFKIAQSSIDPDLQDFIGFDDVVIGKLRTADPGVPEPTTVALVALSLGLLAASSRRKGKA